MKTKIALLSTLLIAGNVAANENNNPWYAGARIGATNYSNFDHNKTSDDTIDNDAHLSGGLFLGHNINDWFALETGYTHLGEVEVADTAEIKNEVLELVGKFTWKPSEVSDIFIKAGAFAYKTKGSGQLSGLTDQGGNGTIGAGVEHHFTDNFSARVEYQFYNHLALADASYESDWNAHLLSLGFIYNWGKSEQVIVQDAPITEAPKAEVVEEKIEIVKKETETVVEEKVEAVEKVVAPVVIAKKEQAVKVVNETAEVYFDTRSNALSAASIKQLKPIIKHLQNYPESTLIVVGHTDSRGSEASNQKLSEKRARSLTDYLVKEYSIDPARITASGKGELSPIADNKTKEGQAKNRRVSVYSPSLTVPQE